MPSLSSWPWEPKNRAKTSNFCSGFNSEPAQKGELPGFRLVLAGEKGWKTQTLWRLLERGKAWGVTQVGYASEEALPALYSGAEVFVFPSLYEGFGMPVLEARACGTRVVATDIPEIREAGEQGAIYVSPTD